MVDITQIESEISLGLSMMQRILPMFLPFLGAPPPVVSLIMAAINGAVHLTSSVAPSVATNLATQNATPGMPNVPELAEKLT